LRHARDMTAYGGNRNGIRWSGRRTRDVADDKNGRSARAGRQRTAAEQQTPQARRRTSVEKPAREEDELGRLRFELETLQDWRGGRPVRHGGHLCSEGARRCAQRDLARAVEVLQRNDGAVHVRVRPVFGVGQALRGAVAVV
jgi:hypothetical protein